MTDVFESKNYRSFLQTRLSALPRNGFGQMKKMAAHLSVSTGFMSQVLNEQRELSLDQMYLACEFLALSELETKYVLKLAQFEKASHHAYKKRLQKELQEIREESKVVSKRIQFKKVLSDDEKAIFYSDWYYSGIRMLCSIHPHSFEELKVKISLPSEVMSEAIQFLLNAGLITESNNRYVIGALSTHIPADSPMVTLHHRNWRRKAMEQVRMKDADKVHYTSPMTLSRSDALKIKDILLKAIEDVGNVVDPSPAEELMCLNIDWFKVHLKD